MLYRRATQRQKTQHGAVLSRTDGACSPCRRSACAVKPVEGGNRLSLARGSDVPSGNVVRNLENSGAGEQQHAQQPCPRTTLRPRAKSSRPLEGPSVRRSPTVLVSTGSPQRRRQVGSPGFPGDTPHIACSPQPTRGSKLISLSSHGGLWACWSPPPQSVRVEYVVPGHLHCPLAAGRQSCGRGAAGHCSSVSHRRSLRHPTEGSRDVQPQLGVRGRRHSSCARRRRSSKPGLCPHRTRVLSRGKQKARARGSDGAKGRVWVAAQRPSQTAGESSSFCWSFRPFALMSG